MNQKEAVFEAIKQLKPHEVDKDAPVTLTKQEKKVVEAKLFDGFRKGRIQYAGEKPSDDRMQLYISGLVSNWLRKDTRLNGHRRYQPQRPGSRTGVVPVATSVADPDQIEALRALTGATDGDIQLFVIRRPVNSQPSQADEADAAVAHE